MIEMLLKMRIKLYKIIRKNIPNKLIFIIKRFLGKRRTWKIAYVILVSDEVHNFMTKLQINILDQYGVNPGLTAIPHITLKLGFDVSCLEPYENYFDSLVKDIEPFEICVNGINKFDEGIIFINVENNPNLDMLRRRILRDLHEQFGVEPYRLEDDQFHFHATLAHGLSKNDFLMAYEGLKKMPVQMCFTLSAMGLFCHTGDNWVSYKQSTIIGNVS